MTRRGAWCCLLLSLTGLGLCAYMYYVHLGLLRGELLGGAACGGSGVFNCHAVTASRWGTALGMPLPLWGIAGYLSTLTLAAIALAFPAAAGPALALLVASGLTFLAVDAALFAVMVTQIRSLCPLCLGSYLLNALLAVSARAGLGLQWNTALRQVSGALRSSVLWLALGAAGLGLAAATGVQASVEFISQSSPSMIRRQLRDYFLLQPRASVESAGSPSLGSATAGVQVMEFSDFHCPTCRRASKFNHIMLSTNPGTRFVFKHFPLDTSCNPGIARMVHPGACTTAAGAACAHQQGKFWPLHDVIFGQEQTYDPSRLRDDALRAGLDLAKFDACMASGEGMQAVRRDVEEAQRLGVTSTPTYFINGYRLGGLMPPAFFRELSRLLREQGS